MIIYNFIRILQARTFDKTYAYLTSRGISASLASRVRQNKVRQLNNEQLEKLCTILNCTPNELMEWVPDQNTKLDATHRLYKIHRPKTITSLNQTINSIPLNKIEEID